MIVHPRSQLVFLTPFLGRCVLVSLLLELTELVVHSILLLAELLDRPACFFLLANGSLQGLALSEAPRSNRGELVPILANRGVSIVGVWQHRKLQHDLQLLAQPFAPRWRVGRVCWPG